MQRLNKHPDTTYVQECSKYPFIKCPGCFLITPDNQHSPDLWTFGHRTTEWMMLKPVSSLFINSCVSLPQNQDLHRSTCQCPFTAWVCKASAAQEILWQTGEQQILDWQHGHFLISRTALDLNLSVPCLPYLMGIAEK